ncbi:MAG: type I-MYXAN CRISPR-associated protein Cas6/Cmx6 [Deltaproteobacteria bacterium]|nr:type I-MYXAN CRISPR-associated protein Cas6/Cmx6 [Deltaproteobacteria bacterium]
MQIVDLAFPIIGRDAPADHGYALYGALCRVVPDLHSVGWLGVHPLPGALVGGKTIQFGREASLRLRLPAERIAVALGLAGTTLDLGGHRLVLGAPRIWPLTPAPSLDARLVVIKLTHLPVANDAIDTKELAKRFGAEAQRQLRKLGIERDPLLRGKRSIEVGGRRVIGYSVRVEGLQPEESLRLQVGGIGGKRAMGCGVFRPTRGTQDR